MLKIRVLLIVLLFVSIVNLVAQDDKKPDMKSNISNIMVKDMSLKDVPLSEYNGKVKLIVNVASKCGYTPQYEGLENLYKKYKDKDFVILAFPCNDFGSQEPGNIKEIKEFCSLTYGVEFPLFNKIKVLGDDKEELYKVLTTSSNVESGDIKWNFEKFLIDKEGNVVERFRSSVKPESEEIVSAIENLL